MILVIHVGTAPSSMPPARALVASRVKHIKAMVGDERRSALAVAPGAAPAP